MGKSKMSRCIFILLTVIMLAGCRSGRYRNPDDDVFGDKRNFEYPQKSRAIPEMVDKLLKDPAFSELYADAVKRAEKRGHRLPTIVISRIEDNTLVGGSDFTATNQIHKELKTALRKTRMFAVIDLYERAKMTDVVESEANGGAKSDNLESVGEYEAGDFMMFGELSKEDVVERVYFHFLNLRLVDPVTGDEVWSDTVKVAKE